MNIDFDSIFAAIGLSSVRRIERLDEFELFAEDRLIQEQAHALALDLLVIGHSLPARDRLEVTVSVDGEAASAGDNEKYSRERISELFDLGDKSVAEVSFRVIIRKEVWDNTLSIYDLKAFEQYLANEPLQQILEAIADRLNGYIKLACVGLLKPGGTATLQLLPAEYVGPTMPPLSSATRERSIALFKETSFSASLPGCLIPLDFQLETPLDRPAIDTFFSRASAVLSAMYLCNNAELKSDDTLSYRLAGYKVLEESITVEALAGAHKVLNRIANWAFDAGGSTDKVGLARNVLSLYVPSLRDLDDQPQVLNAIQSNYQIYLKENVSAYLDVRNRMAELLLESTTKTNALVESLLDSVRNGMLVVFTFVLTVVVVNGLKDASARLIFSVEYLWIVITVAILCSIWIHHACNDVVARFDSAISTTARLLRDSYRNVLIEEEVDQHTASTFDANRMYLREQVDKYRRLWYFVAVILVVMFTVGYLVSYQLPPLAHKQENVGSTAVTSPSPNLWGSASTALSQEVHVGRVPPTAAPNAKTAQISSTDHQAASAYKDVSTVAPSEDEPPAGAGQLQ